MTSLYSEMKKLSVFIICALLFTFSVMAEASLSMTIGGGAERAYVLTDFRSENAKFRISVKRNEESLIIATPPFFRVKISEDITLGEFKTGKLLSALSSDESTFLSFENKIFTEPTTLSLNPEHMGLTVEKEKWALAYSYPTTLFVATGGDKYFLAIKLEEVSASSVSIAGYKADWSKEKLPGFNYSFLSGFSRNFKMHGLSVLASSYVKGKSNTLSLPSLTLTSFLQTEWKALSFSLSSLYGSERTNTFSFTLNSSLHFSVEETLGNKPIYGMTSQYRKVSLTTEFSYSGFEIRGIHTRINGTDNSVKEESEYRFKYSAKDINALVETSLSRTDGIHPTSYTLSLELNDAQLSLNAEKIRLVLSCTVVADDYSLKLSINQDRVLTMVFKYSYSEAD